MRCPHCHIEDLGGLHTPDYCVEVLAEVITRLPIARSMMLRRPSRTVEASPPPVSLGPWAGPSARDKAHGDREAAKRAWPRPPWVPAPHVLPDDELALLTTAEAAGVGHEALTVAVYHCIQVRSDARRERIEREHAERMRPWRTAIAEPGLSARRIAPCACCGRPGAVPGRVLCGPCRRLNQHDRKEST